LALTIDLTTDLSIHSTLKIKRAIQNLVHLLVTKFHQVCVSQDERNIIIMHDCFPHRSGFAFSRHKNKIRSKDKDKFGDFGV